MRVLVADKVEDILVERLKEKFHVDYLPDISRNDLIKIISDYDILIVRGRTKVDRELLDKGKRIRLVARAGVGLDNIDVEYAVSKGIKIVNAPAAPTPSVAELAIGLMITVARRIPIYVQAVKSGEWPKGLYGGMELSGKVLGVIGFGRIGRHVAGIARAMGMTVLTYDVADVSKYAQDYGVRVVELDELLMSSHVISLHVPLTRETYHMMNDETLRIVRDGAIIVNTSRGEVIDAAALLKHIDRLWGVGLDVLEHEPPKTEEERALLRHPKVFITPHIGSETREAQLRIAEELAMRVIEEA